MNIYLFGPNTERTQELQVALQCRGYRTRSVNDVLDPDDYMNRGRSVPLHMLPTMQLGEMVEADATVITEECGRAEVLHLLSTADFGALRVVRYEDLPLEACDCSSEMLDRIDLVNYRRHDAHAVGVLLRVKNVMRRIDAFLGEHLKNPMTRNAGEEAPA